MIHITKILSILKHLGTSLPPINNAVQGERWLQCQTGRISCTRLILRATVVQSFAGRVSHRVFCLTQNPASRLLFPCLPPLSCKSKRYLTIVTQNIRTILKNDIASPSPVVSPTRFSVVCIFLSVQAACSCGRARRLLERRGGREYRLIYCGC